MGKALGALAGSLASLPGLTLLGPGRLARLDPSLHASQV